MPSRNSGRRAAGLTEPKRNVHIFGRVQPAPPSVYWYLNDLEAVQNSGSEYEMPRPIVHGLAGERDTSSHLSYGVGSFVSQEELEWIPSEDVAFGGTDIREIPSALFGRSRYPQVVWVNWDFQTLEEDASSRKADALYASHEASPWQSGDEQPDTSRAGTVNPTEGNQQTYPYTRRLLKINALTAVGLFSATAVLASAGAEQVAYFTLLCGGGFMSLAGTMLFRLIRLR